MSTVSRREFLAAGAIAPFAVTASGTPPKLSVATFSEEVTPPLGHGLMGGGIAPAKEIVDPLYANGFVLLGAGDPIAVVAVDWCEIRNDAYDQLARRDRGRRRHQARARPRQRPAPARCAGRRPDGPENARRGEIHGFDLRCAVPRKGGQARREGSERVIGNGDASHARRHRPGESRARRVESPLSG